MVRGTEQSVVAGLFGDDTVLLARSERMLLRIVDEFDRMSRRRLKLIAGRSKAFDWARKQTTGFKKAIELGLRVQRNATSG